MKLKDSDLLRQQAYIGGKWCDADNGEIHEVRNPADGKRIGTVPMMCAAETRRAIEAADAAWRGWRSTTAKERGQLLRRWHELIVANSDDLAMIMTLEQGKPLREAKGEINYATGFIEWFSEEARRSYGVTVPSPWPDKRIIVTREPVGVSAAITPWNFPSAMITRKAGAALAAGCPMVVKPAEATPYSALALAVLAERAGIPPGVFSVVTGSASEIGGEMTSNPTVRKLSFTGSTAVGRLLMQQCAPTIKKISLELGGNAPFIVFDDADVQAAVKGALAAKYRNTGQACIAANRIYVQDAIYDAFAQQFAAEVAKMKVGNGLEPDVMIGPLINEKAVEKVERQVQDATQKHGRILLGGKRHALGHGFFEPTVVTEASTDMLLATEETFGPMAPLFRFKTEDEAIAQANATEFGLASYFYARDIGRVWRVAEALETGMVGINTGAISSEVAPFGGVKQSGLGREGSMVGMDEYQVLKYICMGGV